MPRAARSGTAQQMLVPLLRSAQPARSAATPGSVRPSIHSRNAPPAVETKVKSCATPAWLSAATVSPPPATETRLPSLVSAAAVLRQRHRRRVERRRFERAERPVPDQRPASLQRVGERLDRRRADVEDHLVRGDLVDIAGAQARRVGREFFRHDHVVRQMDRAAGRFGPLEDALGFAGQIMLARATCRHRPRARRGRCWPCRRR